MRATSDLMQPKVFLRCYLCLRFISMPKIQGINWFAPEILIIKGSINLIEQEVYLATPIQEYQFQIPSSLDGYVHVKNARYQQIPSRDIDIQKTWLLYLVIRRHAYLVSASLKHDPKLSVKVDDVRKRTDYNNDEGIEESDSPKGQFRLFMLKRYNETGLMFLFKEGLTLTIKFHTKGMAVFITPWYKYSIYSLTNQLT